MELSPELAAVAQTAAIAARFRDKSRIAGAREKFDAALATGRPYCAPDSLILARLLLAAHAALFHEAKARGEDTTGFRGVGALDEAVAILAQRAQAGTLMPCLPLEAAFYCAAENPLRVVDRIDGSMSREPAASLCQFMGYVDFIGACAFLAKPLLLRALLGTARTASTAEHEGFVLRGLDLMVEAHAASGWPGQRLWVPEECVLLRGLQSVKNEIVLVLPGTWAEALFRKLDASGCVEQALDSRFAAGLSKRPAAEAFTEGVPERKRAADVAKHGLRCCALPSCGDTEPHPKLFKLCGRCHVAAYCCATHSVEDWKRHKREDGCKAAS
jgi:hypothetical protein